MECATATFPSTTLSHRCDDYAEQSLLWVTRILDLPEQRQLYLRKAECLPEITALLCEDAAPLPMDIAALDTTLDRAKRRLEQGPANMPDVLSTNVATLGDLLGLDATERRLLSFRVVCRINPALYELTYGQTDWTEARLFRVMGQALGHPAEAVAAALSPRGRLVGSGMVVMSAEAVTDFKTRMGVYRGLTRALITPQRDADALLSFATEPATPPVLTREDFGYLEDQVASLSQYLQRAAQQQQAGCNLLILGESGVGKTQLAKLLALVAGLHLHAVPVFDSMGGAADPGERLDAWRLTQMLYAKAGRDAILFDEVDDVIAAPDCYLAIRARRVWLNRLLEESPIPTIWVGSSAPHFDASALSRFDIVFRLEPPPKAWRQKLLSDKLAPLGASGGDLRRWSHEPDITPAIVARTTKVLGLVPTTATVSATDRIDQLIAGYLGASRKQPKPRSARLPPSYSPAFINASVDTERLALRLAQRPRGRLLFHGPSGSGKTAFAHYVADHLDRPLLTKHASDLLGRYVGETEYRLSQLFEEARREGAVLLLDEVDSFLHSRERTVTTWEVTQVNELLVQIENFEGLFICTTNRLNELDAAALRRFSVVVAFEPLRENQRCDLFWRTVGTDRPETNGGPQVIESRLRQLTGLTAGDFAAARERFELLGDNLTAESLLAALREASQLKTGGGRLGIGFAAYDAGTRR